MLAAGEAAFVAGDLLWVYYDHTGSRPFPSPADVLYLAGYPLLAAAFLLFIRRRIGDGDRAGLLDAAILTTAAAVLTWTFLMEPSLVGADTDPLALAISAAYPICDVLLIGVLMGLLVTPGARTTAFVLLAASVLLLLVADQGFAVQTLDDTYAAGGPLDVTWLLAYLMAGGAALHPSMRALSQPNPVAVAWLGPVRLLFLAAAMLTGPLIMTLGRPGADTGLWVIAGGTALLSMLVLARLAGLVGMLARDVEQRRALEQRLSHQAFHDPLTGLANRRLFVQRVEAALGARTEPGRIAVLFIDLDDFKTVNDELGHAAGDDVLVAVGARLIESVRTEDVAARLGGDEFGILLEGLVDRATAMATADRLLRQVSIPVAIGGLMVPVAASIGLALDTSETRSVDDLLGAADVAMYGAKAAGKSMVQAAVGDDSADRIPAPAGLPAHARRSVTGRLAEGSAGA
jgi:diguanylate cyclase (GGDEF)-like protein